MSTSPVALTAFRNPLVLRLALLAVLLLAEVLLVTVRFDTVYIPDSYKLLVFMGHSGKLLKLAVTIGAVLMILCFYRFGVIRTLAQEHALQPRWKYWLAAHVACYVFFLAVTWLIFKFAWHRHFLINLAVLLWIACAGATLLTLMLSAFPYRFWIRFTASEKYSIVASVVLGGLAWFLAQQTAFYAEQLNELTFRVCYWVLGLFFDEPYALPGQRLLGVSSFVVRIKTDCSGYEGMGLVAIFLGIYLWLYRSSLRFPHALLLFPIGIFASWALNILRIVALVAIGSQWSPRVALGGFHSNAGWISFVSIGLGLVWLCHRFALFSVQQPKAAPSVGDSANAHAVTALLLPFIVLLGSILLTQAVVHDFDWLYPVRVTACGIVLWYFRDYYRRVFVDLKWHAFAIGLFVFLLWLLLVPYSAQDDSRFAASLFSAAPWVSGVWILFRILGAVITVPLIEELLFRGYLINRLSGEKNHWRFGHFTLLSFLLSSLLFGLLHGQWLAGTLAGMGFAGALYVRRQLVDAVVAHMTTNALLAVYVICTGHWSLW